MKIGIFGGCFNPPHIMHKNIPISLIKLGYVDKVIYVPTESSYQKEGLIPFQERYDMLKLMIDNRTNVEVSDIASRGYCYTYQVLDYFNNGNDDIYFICGSDNLKEFKTWKKSDYILANYQLLIIKRKNSEIEKILKDYTPYLDNIIIADIDEYDISSTVIRDDVENNNEYIDRKVYQYIKEKKIY